MNNVKKLMLAALAVVLTFSMIAFAETTPEVPPHEHTFTDGPYWNGPEPHCPGETGEAVFWCTYPGCQAEETRRGVPGTGAHDYQNYEPTKPATCTESGYEEGYCIYCDAPDTRTVAALGHQYGEAVVTVPGTCVTPAQLTKTCTRAGCTEATEGHTVTETGALDPANHEGPVNDVAAVEATCTEPGKTAGKQCSACNAITEGATEVAAKGHTWERNGFDINSKANQTAANGWTVDTQPDVGVEGSGHYECEDCGADSPAVTLDALPEPSTEPSTPTTTPKPTKKPSSGNSKPSSGSSSSSNAAPAATEAPALPYGSIVSDVERAEEPYVSEPLADETGANTILVITADPDEDGTYTLRNLHLTDALLGQLKSEGILTVRFVVGDATVEFPVASYTGDAATTIRGDLEADVTAFLVTIDPNATTADGTAGVSVGSSVTTSDGGEYDITPLIPDITLSIGGTAAQPVTTATVYTADASAATPVEEPAFEEAPAEPAIEEAPAEPALEDSAAA